MRYRRLGYQYVVVSSEGTRALTEALRSRAMGFVLFQTRWSPPTDVYETPSGLFVTVEVAGVNEESIDVVLYENALVIEGHRRLPPMEPGGVFHAAEIRQGPFRVEIGVPSSVDHERVEARYDRGLLHIALPRLQGR